MDIPSWIIDSRRTGDKVAQFKWTQHNGMCERLLAILYISGFNVQRSETMGSHVPNVRPVDDAQRSLSASDSKSMVLGKFLKVEDF